MSARSITVQIKPVGKERARRDPDSGHWYTPEQTAQAEMDIRDEWSLSHRGFAWGAHVPLRLVVEAVMERPRSVKRKWPTVRPDFDNIAKLIDSLNKIAFADDAQIVDGRSWKRYCLPGEQPHLEITLEEMDE